MKNNLNIKKKKIAILHPSFGWGGAEAVCVWVIYALKDDFDIDLVVISKENVNISKINQFYGTKFKKNDFKIIHLHYLINGFILNSHLVQRYFKNNKNKYDFAVSTCNEMDFEKRGIQYIHYPCLYITKKENNLFKKLYYKLCFYLSGYKEERMKQNFTLTNSYWTQKVIEMAYGIKSGVVYPSILADFPSLEWEKKEDGFICLGRISSGKNLEVIIEILIEVKKEFPNIHLHIIGHVQNISYFKKINEIVKKNSDWVSIESSVSRKKLNEYLVSHKYGIHGMKNEHFGIVIAEMIKAGSIVFIPNCGGQVEIVDSEKRLTYRDKIDAIRKIKNVLRDNTLQKELLFKLKKRSNQFSKKKFINQIKAQVHNYINIYFTDN